MGNDRITSVYNSRVVTSLVEHTHVKTKYVGKVYGTACTTLIRRYNHHMLRINLKVRLSTEKTLYKLICRLYCLKSLRWNSVLNSWVVSIESDDVVNAHACKLLKCKSTVKGLTSCSLMLSALVKERHDNSDSSCLTTYSSNNTLKVLIMVIRRHVVLMTTQRICHRVISDINH